MATLAELEAKRIRLLNAATTVQLIEVTQRLLAAATLADLDEDDARVLEWMIVELARREPTFAAGVRAALAERAG